MHGRVKVRTPKEQQEAKQRERAEKVKAYHAAIEKVYAKREEQLHDAEAWKLTEKLLLQNPDISTLWNFRREMFEKLLPNVSEDQQQKQLNGDLLLVEHCLHNNPKSYSIWLHRRWVMGKLVKPDWERERDLCNLFLKYDERNFHCWDYRRFVISSAQMLAEDEFAFTYDKITANFSNYSAWHYRSKLLPVVRPAACVLSGEEGEEGEGKGEGEGGGKGKGVGVAEEALAKEFELVQNATYTDPSDQSTWFYYRWLLGKCPHHPSMSCILVKKSSIFVVFKQPVLVNPLVVSIGSSILSCPQLDWPECLWEIPIPDDIIAKLSADTDHMIHIKCHGQEVGVAFPTGEEVSENWWIADSVFMHNPTATLKDRLRLELESCQELRQLEPDNKWCLLTTHYLMLAVDPVKYQSDVEEILLKLVQVDPYRRGYYKDLLSKFRVEQTLRRALSRDHLTKDKSLDLSGKSLARLHYTELMMLFASVSLSKNELTHLPKGVEHFHCVRSLVLDQNYLETLSCWNGNGSGPGRGLAGLSSLRSLSVKGNKLATFDAVCEGLKDSCVEELWLEGNPVCALAGLEEALVAAMPRLKALDGRTVQRAV